jgi:putative redox protein
MKAKINWKENLSFNGASGKHSVNIDTKSPVGNDTGASPKELVAMAIAACSGMDVISLLKKYKQLPTSFNVEADVEQTEPHKYPTVFKTVLLDFHIDGQVDEEKVMEAVTLSMTEYCGVAAMIAKGCPITYKVHLNSKQIGEGKAEFA